MYPKLEYSHHKHHLFIHNNFKEPKDIFKHQEHRYILSNEHFINKNKGYIIFEIKNLFPSMYMNALSTFNPSSSLQTVTMVGCNTTALLEADI